MKYILIFLCFILFIACGGGSSSTSTNKADTQVDNEVQITLELSRIISSGLDDIKVNVELKKNSESYKNANITYVVSKGQKSILTNNNDGTYWFSISPSSTGEYKIDISVDNKSITRTALVLDDVNQNWGQAEEVRGLVNTKGYEDGITITPDGEYLFVQYGPYLWSSLLVYQNTCASTLSTCTHTWVNTIVDDLTSVNRPDFYLNRFNNLTQRHNLASWNIGDNASPFYALTTMFYGFKRAEDGSFSEPFYLAFDDFSDGVIGPYGLSFLKLSDKSYRTVFSHKDSYTSAKSASVPDVSFDVYTFDATFEANNILGVYNKYASVAPPYRSSNFSSSLVDFGDNNYGTQGNPFLYSENSVVKSIWTDDEYDNDSDSDKISVYVKNSGTFPSTSDWSKVVLPSNVNTASKNSLQPSFIDNELFFTQDFSIVKSTFSGSHTVTDLSNNSFWSLPTTIIQKDSSVNILNASTSDIGKIVSLGEPSIAIRDNKKILYFLYAYVRSVDSVTNYADLDFQAGFIYLN